MLDIFIGLTFSWGQRLYQDPILVGQTLYFWAVALRVLDARQMFYRWIILKNTSDGLLQDLPEETEEK